MTDTQPKTTPATFCIWLQGFLEGAGSELTSDQLSVLKEKLHAVFTHFDPDSDCRTSDSVSEELRRVYDEYLRDRWKKDPFCPSYPLRGRRKPRFKSPLRITLTGTLVSNPGTPTSTFIWGQL